MEQVIGRSNLEWGDDSKYSPSDDFDWFDEFSGFSLLVRPKLNIGFGITVLLKRIAYLVEKKRENGGKFEIALFVPNFCSSSRPIPEMVSQHYSVSLESIASFIDANCERILWLVDDCHSMDFPPYVKSAVLGQARTCDTRVKGSRLFPRHPYGITNHKDFIEKYFQVPSASQRCRALLLSLKRAYPLLYRVLRKEICFPLILSTTRDARVDFMMLDVARYEWYNARCLQLCAESVNLGMTSNTKIIAHLLKNYMSAEEWQSEALQEGCFKSMVLDGSRDDGGWRWNVFRDFESASLPLQFAEVESAVVSKGKVKDVRMRDFLAAMWVSKRPWTEVGSKVKEMMRGKSSTTFARIFFFF